MSFWLNFGGVVLYLIVALVVSIIAISICYNQSITKTMEGIADGTHDLKVAYICLFICPLLPMIILTGLLYLIWTAIRALIGHIALAVERKNFERESLAETIENEKPVNDIMVNDIKFKKSEILKIDETNCNRGLCLRRPYDRW